MRNPQGEIGAVVALETSKLLRATRAGSQPRYRPAEQQHQLSIGSPIETPLPPSADAGKSDPAGIPRRIGAGSDSHRHLPSSNGMCTQFAVTKVAIGARNIGHAPAQNAMPKVMI